jgi:hypothetical protein
VGELKCVAILSAIKRAIASAPPAGGNPNINLMGLLGHSSAEKTPCQGHATIVPTDNAATKERRFCVGFI